MRHSRRLGRVRILPVALALLTVISVIWLTGCYRRVIRAEGPGTQDVTTYEPNLKDGEEPIDLFGTD